MLNFSLTGTSPIEILRHENLTDRLIAGMKLLGFCHLPKFTSGGLNAFEKYTDPEWVQFRACYGQWSKAAAQTTSLVSKAWYEEKSKALLAGELSLTKTLRACTSAQTDTEDSSASKISERDSCDQDKSYFC